MSQAIASLSRCRDFLSNAIVPAPIMVKKEDFLLMVGTLLAVKDAPCAVFEGEKGTYNSIYGYQIVNLILASKPEELYDRLWLPAWRAAKVSPPSRLPIVQLDDKCTNALGLMVANRFGDLLFLDDNGRPAGVLSLKDIVTSIAGTAKAIGIKLKEITSELKLTDGRTSLIEVFRFLMSNRVRRIVIKRTGKFYCCTEREIMRALFTLNGMQSLRDDPDTLLSTPIEQLVSPYLSPVPNLRGTFDVASGWVQAAESISCTVIVDNELIASPWDLIIKPFLVGKFPF